MRADNTQVANIDMFEPLDAARAPIDAPFMVFDPRSLVGYAADFYRQDEWRWPIASWVAASASLHRNTRRGYPSARRRKSSNSKQMAGRDV
jgi:hypothetical protein